MMNNPYKFGSLAVLRENQTSEDDGRIQLHIPLPPPRRPDEQVQKDEPKRGVVVIGGDDENADTGCIIIDI